MTTSTSLRRAAATAVFAGAAVLTASPAFAQPTPADPTGDGTGAAQITAPSKAQIEQAERAQLERQSASDPAGFPSEPSDPSTLPIALLGMVGGGLVAGTVGYTMYRHHSHQAARAATA